MAIDNNKPVVEVTLSQETVRELRDKIRDGSIAIVVANDSVAAKLRPFMVRGQHFGNGTQITVVTALDPQQLASDTRSSQHTFLWPGVPTWAEGAVSARGVVRSLNCISDETLTRVRAAILDAAIAHERDAIWREAGTTPSTTALPLSVDFTTSSVA